MIGWTIFFISFVIVMLLFGNQLLDYLLRGILAFWFKVPAYHYGVKERWGKRLTEIYFEGGHFKWPFVDEVELVSMELRDADIKVSFTTEDKLQLTVVGTLQYRPDPYIPSPAGQNLFIEMSEEIVESGIGDALEAKLGALGGVKGAAEFITNRQAISDYVDCYLRLKDPPHLSHPEKCGVAGCTLKPGKISGVDVIDYYAKHWEEVRNLIAADKKRGVDSESVETGKKKAVSDSSEMENLYGIDAVRFVMSSVDFSDITKAAFEKEQQAKANAKGLEVRKQTIVELIGAGLTAQLAVDEVNVSQDDRIVPQVISVQGNVPAILLGSGIPGLSAPPTKEGGKSKSTRRGGR